MSNTRFSGSRSETMFALIEEYLNGAKTTQREFCSNHQLAYSTFQLYLSRYRRLHPVPNAASADQFIPLVLSQQAIATNSHPACEIAWPDGTVIRFGVQPNPEYLLALIKGENTRL